MINYKHVKKNSLESKIVDELYKELLQNRWQFLIIEVKNIKYCLTKEKSIFQIQNEEQFIEKAKKDVYYKTIFNNTSSKESLYKQEDLELYKKYLDKYQSKMENTIYGDKYLFGSVAVRTKDNNFITTIRGKENFLEYTIVTKVDHRTHIVEVADKKATLNAPLLAHIFENSKVKAIVHINHFFDKKISDYEYAFPGTTKDSLRPNHTSFNIKYHGVIYLFDENGNLL